MKQVLSVFLFVFCAATAWCDTLDYWHVSYNDSVIARFNSNSTELTVELSAGDITETDSIHVQMGSDNICVTCTYDLSVVSSQKQLLLKQTQKGDAPVITFSVALMDLLKHGENVDDRFFFYYHRNYYDKDGPGPKEADVLRLKLAVR